MSTITTTSRTRPTVPARTARRLGRWFQRALAVIVLVGVAFLAAGVITTTTTAPSAATFDADAATARLVSLGYLTEEGVRERQVTQDLQNRGLVPTGPAQAAHRPSAEEVETHRLISRGLIPAGSGS